MNCTILNFYARLAMAMLLCVSCSHAKPDEIEFVHIGKTGGTSARAHLSKISHHGINFKYTHCQKPDVENHSTFIVTARHPVDRIVSWFLYNHPKNNPKGTKFWVPHQVELWDSCFENIDDLATDGLDRKVGTNEKRPCQKLARSLILGNTTLRNTPNFSYHDKNYLHVLRNYRFYVSELLNKAKEKTIMVLRTENLLKDWQSMINSVYGKESAVNVHDEMGTRITHRENKVVKITSKYISKEGLKNLCYYLCHEIQLYRKLIIEAVNLSALDKRISLRKIRETCPFEARSKLGICDKLSFW